MKVLTINGPKAATLIFACLCAIVIAYVGFFSPNTMPVASHNEPINYVAVIVNGFGTGLDGTKEFMYLDLPFTAIVSPEGTYAEADTALLRSANNEILERFTPNTLDVYKIENTSNMSKTSEKIENILDTTDIYRILFIDLGKDANYTAHALNSLYLENNNLHFITISQLLSMLD